jgi:hypothetical protein
MTPAGSAVIMVSSPVVASRGDAGPARTELPRVCCSRRYQVTSPERHRNRWLRSRTDTGTGGSARGPTPHNQDSLTASVQTAGQALSRATGPESPPPTPGGRYQRGSSTPASPLRKYRDRTPLALGRCLVSPCRPRLADNPLADAVGPLPTYGPGGRGRRRRRSRRLGRHESRKEQQRGDHVDGGQANDDGRPPPYGRVVATVAGGQHGQSPPRDRALTPTT